jgi:hypothetical protein
MSAIRLKTIMSTSMIFHLRWREEVGQGKASAGSRIRARAYPLVMKGVNQLTKRFTKSSAVKRAVKTRLSLSKVGLQLDSSKVCPI